MRNEYDKNKFYKAPEIKPSDPVRGLATFAKDIAAFHAINKASGFSDFGSCLFILFTYVAAVVLIWAAAYVLVGVNLLDILTGKA